MATTLSSAARSAACNAVVDLLDAGSGAGKIRLQSAAGAYLCDIALDDPAFGNAAAGVASAAGLPNSGVGLAAAGTGTACTKFEATDSDNNVIYSGTVTVTGGGGDITIDNTSIAENQTVNLTSLTHTQPA